MDRAFSGLSMGGMLTNSVMINHPEAFQYFGMMSAGLPPANAELTPPRSPRSRASPSGSAAASRT